MSPATALSCKQLVELVSDYIEGVLPPAERERFEQHLAGCDGCSQYLRQMRLTIQMLGKLTEDSLDPEARERLLEVFRDWKSQPPAASPAPG